MGARFAPADQAVTNSASGVTVIAPPESGFYAKRLDYEGIPSAVLGKALRSDSGRALSAAFSSPAAGWEHEVSKPVSP